MILGSTEPPEKIPKDTRKNYPYLSYSFSGLTPTGAKKGGIQSTAESKRVSLIQIQPIIDVKVESTQ
jgi:hypothetical protein